MLGTGVVMSAGVYLRLIGNIFVLRGAVKRDALNGSIARPLVVVHSGKTATARFGYRSMSVCRSTRLARLGGAICG